MREELLHHLRQITAEEKALLQGHADIQKEIYTSSREFVVDNAKLLQRGHLIEIRPHTRFTHFPRHRHNYAELVYMCCGSTTHHKRPRQDRPAGRRPAFSQPGRRP